MVNLVICSVDPFQALLKLVSQGLRERSHVHDHPPRRADIKSSTAALMWRSLYGHVIDEADVALASATDDDVAEPDLP